jgi:hypothetical protein
VGVTEGAGLGVQRVALISISPFSIPASTEFMIRKELNGFFSS